VTKRAAEKKRKSRQPPRGQLVNVRFPRITVHPDRMGGMPSIRDLRIAVANVLRLLAANNSDDAILDACPHLEREDLHESREYAAWLAQFHDDLLQTS
jgi:uncharacterized protein (DUF433 family)